MTFLRNVYISISISYFNSKFHISSKKNVFFLYLLQSNIYFCLLHGVTKEYVGQGKAVSVFEL